MKYAISYVVVFALLLGGTLESVYALDRHRPGIQMSYGTQSSKAFVYEVKIRASSGSNAECLALADGHSFRVRVEFREEDEVHVVAYDFTDNDAHAVLPAEYSTGRRKMICRLDRNGRISDLKIEDCAFDFAPQHVEDQGGHELRDRAAFVIRSNLASSLQGCIITLPVHPRSPGLSWKNERTEWPFDVAEDLLFPVNVYTLDAVAESPEGSYAMISSRHIKLSSDRSDEAFAPSGLPRYREEVYGEYEFDLTAKVIRKAVLVRTMERNMKARGTSDDSDSVETHIGVIQMEISLLESNEL